MRTTKKETELRKGYAYRLFMSGESQKSIAAVTGVTETTISRWAIKEGWQQSRESAENSTINLANTLMEAAQKMSELIIRNIKEGAADINTITKCSDNLSKIMAAAERIANKVTRATIIDVIIALDRWVMEQSRTNPDVTPELARQIVSVHQKYINHITEKDAGGK